MEEFEGRKDVEIAWFAAGFRTTGRPYERFIEGYDPSDPLGGYAKGRIDELFTELEAARVKGFVDQISGHYSVTKIKPAKLPIPNNSIGLGAIPASNSHDFCILSMEQGYCLPIDVWGWIHSEGYEKSVTSFFHTFCGG